LACEAAPPACEAAELSSLHSPSQVAAAAIGKDVISGGNN
jgi:hypothetical protein